MDQTEKLKALIKTRFGNNQAAFARAIKRSPSQVNQWLTGYRTLDVKGSRHIERALELATDYFFSATPSGTEQLATTPPTSKATQNRSAYQFERVDSSEVVEITEIAKHLDAVGQGMLLQSARTIAKEREALRKGNKVMSSI